MSRNKDKAMLAEESSSQFDVECMRDEAKRRLGYPEGEWTDADVLNSSGSIRVGYKYDIHPTESGQPRNSVESECDYVRRIMNKNVYDETNRIFEAMDLIYGIRYDCSAKNITRHEIEDALTSGETKEEKQFCSEAYRLRDACIYVASQCTAEQHDNYNTQMKRLGAILGDNIVNDLAFEPSVMRGNLQADDSESGEMKFAKSFLAAYTNPYIAPYFESEIFMTGRIGRFRDGSDYHIDELINDLNRQSQIDRLGISSVCVNDIKMDDFQIFNKYYSDPKNYVMYNQCSRSDPFYGDHNYAANGAFYLGEPITKQEHESRLSEYVFDVTEPATYYTIGANEFPCFSVDRRPNPDLDCLYTAGYDGPAPLKFPKYNEQAPKRSSDETIADRYWRDWSSSSKNSPQLAKLDFTFKEADNKSADGPTV